jgi:hypothetical protein
MKISFPSRRWLASACTASVFLITACGGGSDGPVNPPVSAATRAILDADPAEYASLPALSNPGYGAIGRIAPRSAAELAAAGLSSHLMIGGETTDRGFSNFSNWREFLGPLGASKVRVQPGWNDVEKVITTPATYDFGKFDEIVDGALAQKVHPYVSLGYGNERPGCTNCGSKGLGGAFPTAEGKVRWMNFVTAIVTRYKDKVTDWQIWNEPNGNLATLDTYKVFIVDVAREIKRIQPNAKITIGAFLDTTYAFNGGSASNIARMNYIETSLKYFNDNKGASVPSSDVLVGFHPYIQSVDYDTKFYDGVSMDRFLALVRSYGFTPIMDENGAPSTPCAVYAMCNNFTTAWSQANQAKYNLRRVLGDLGRGIETSTFTITDMHYDDAKNTKGLLETGAWNAAADTPFMNGDQTVKGKKLAFAAFQNVTAIFDNRAVAITDHGCIAPAGYAVHAWSRTISGKKQVLLAAWQKTVLPTASLAKADVTIECSNLSFIESASTGEPPVYADSMDGRVYKMPPTAVIKNNPGTNGSKIIIPVGDWPVLIADPSFVPMASKK